MRRKRLKAKTPRRRKSSGGGSSFDYTGLLVGAFLFFLLAAILWYAWPRPGPPTTEQENQRKLKELTTQHPDAEVFDMGGGEKKK